MNDRSLVDEDEAQIPATSRLSSFTETLSLIVRIDANEPDKNI